jgi:Uma2 family endonuclease
MRAYESAGVLIYVIVDLKNRTLEVHRLQDGKYGKPEILQGDAIWQPDELPGLKLEVAKLWF